ncbi:MAG: cell division FtsK/SpoIIIE [Ignavibacteria bacterium]|nr:cell division FtsK/SpoIIIE [Ignavibacteria bacterium]
MSEQNIAPESENIAGLERQILRKINIISVLLFFLAAFLFIALISYTSDDEANAELSFGEIVQILRGNEIVSAKIETTHNWLGLLGAVVSNTLYNKTFGYSMFMLPFMVAIWAKNLFKRKTIPAKLLKRTIIFLLTAVFFASMMGAIAYNFPDFSKEWSGIGGSYLAGICIKFIGVFGAFLLFLTLLIITFLLGANISPKQIYSAIRRIYSDYILRINFKHSFSSFLQKIRLNKNTENIDETSIPVDKVQLVEVNKQVQPPIISDNRIPTQNKENFIQANEEPARIIRTNIILNTDNDVLPNLAEIRNDALFEDDMDFPKRQTVFGKSGIKPVIQFPGQVQSNASIKQDSKAEPKVKEDTNTQNVQSNLTNETKGNYLSEIKLPNIPEHIEIPKEKILKNVTPQPEPITIEEEERKLSVKITRIESEQRPPTTLSTPVLEEKITYKYPPLSLLAQPTERFDINRSELEMNARLLQEKLETFKIYIENLNITPGPVVTQYEFVPAPGIKISKIESLADDLAMALKARGIRIIAPIPGKGTIGIEIPNSNPATVRFSEIVGSAKFIAAGNKLPLGLGKTISGDVFVADLTKMPHLLIAGSTGSGKSVGINTIIASLLYKMHPKQLKFVIIDPKKVELQQYSRLENHFLAVCPDIDDEIITNPKDAVIALKAVTAEMEQRYDILAKVGQRNIQEYNAKVAEGKFADNKDFLHLQLPYIVVIIDELADLMITAGKEIEEPITRIAQMARAIGIHLIIATQRPSVDVITGIIKANFPARIAYLVAQKVDSRTIIDGMGAEQLLGNGDMLFLPSGVPKPIRIQNAYISTEEIESICDFIGSQEGYTQPYFLPSLIEKKTNGNEFDGFDRDPLFEEAARLVIRHQQGSVSLIQRRLKVGYARAGRIVDELERAGIVGSFDGSKARQVLMESESELEAVL